MKIKYIIQITLTTVLGPHKIMVARGFTKKPRIETVVCVVFFLFLYSYVVHKWGLLGWDHGGGSLVHGQYIYKNISKLAQKLAPFTTSQSIHLIIVEINLFYVQFFLFCSRSEKSKFN